MIEIPAKVTKFLGSPRTAIFLKAAILAIALIFIYVKLNGLSGFIGRSQHLFSAAWERNPIGLIGLIALFPINYLLEAIKWKWLLRKLVPITRWAGIKAIFSGLTLGFITPYAISDYAGRILFLPHHVRVSIILPLFIGRFSQFVVTVVAGSIALVYVYVQTSGIQLFDWRIMSVVLPASLLSPVVLFLIRKRIWGLLKKWLPADWVYQFSIGSDSFTVPEIGVTWLICLARYLIFVSQYVLVFYFFGFPGPGLSLLAAIALIFFAKSTLPTFNFMSDLGVREFAALIFLEYTHMPNDTIVLASLTVWFVNILLPAVVGLFFVQQIKLMDKK